MKIQKLLLCLGLLLAITACGSDPVQEEDLFEKHIDEITAAKTRYAVAKAETPVLNTHYWDNVLGGDSGDALKYDQYGEVDELVFVAPEGTFFTLQRQIRKKTRAGVETILYKVTTPDYTGDENLWVDGRFLDLRDARPEVTKDSVSVAKTIVTLRSYAGIPYTWHGSSATGAPDLLDYYPPTEDLTLRTRNDWIFKGFDSIGMLYRASGGETPLTLKELSRFGESVYFDLEDALLNGLPAEDIAPEPTEDSETSDAAETPEEAPADESSPRTYTAEDKVNLLMSKLEPLDVIISGERVWIVLDNEQIIEARYRSKFDGDVVISALYDTLSGLLQKATFAKDPFDQPEEDNSRTFSVRRYVTKSRVMVEASKAEDAAQVKSASESSSEDETEMP